MDSMGGILTNGLGGDCTAMIIGPFRLKLFIEDIPVEPEIPKGGSGGAAPSLWQRLRDLEDQQDDYVQTPTERKKIILHLRFNNRVIKREYVVTKDRANNVVTLINSINGVANKVTIRLRHSVTVKFVNNARSTITGWFTKKTVKGNVKKPTVTGKPKD